MFILIYHNILTIIGAAFICLCTISSIWTLFFEKILEYILRYIFYSRLCYEKSNNLDFKGLEYGYFSSKQACVYGGSGQSAIPPWKGTTFDPPPSSCKPVCGWRLPVLLTSPTGVLKGCLPLKTPLGEVSKQSGQPIAPFCSKQNGSGEQRLLVLLSFLGGVLRGRQARRAEQNAAGAACKQDLL